MFKNGHKFILQDTYQISSWSNAFVFCYFSMLRPLFFPLKPLGSLTELVWKLHQLELTDEISKAWVIWKTFRNIFQKCSVASSSFTAFGDLDERKGKGLQLLCPTQKPQVAVSI